MKRVIVFCLTFLVACILCTLPAFCANEPADPNNPSVTVPVDTEPAEIDSFYDSVLNVWGHLSSVVTDALTDYYDVLYPLAILSITFMGSGLCFFLLIMLSNLFKVR